MRPLGHWAPCRGAALSPSPPTLTYPELWHLDDEAHGHVDDGALPVVHGDKVGGQLVEPRVQPARGREESVWGGDPSPQQPAPTGS